MFKKKQYTPVTLTKVPMLALDLVTERLRFVLGEAMIRIFQMTIDQTNYTESSRSYSDFDHKSFVFFLSVLCRIKDGKTKLVEVEAKIDLIEASDGEFFFAGGIETDTLRFPGCHHLKGASIYFGSVCRPIRITRACLWFVNVNSDECETSDSPIMEKVRGWLLE